MIRDHDSMSWTTDAAMSLETHQDRLGFGGTEGNVLDDRNNPTS